MSELATIDAYGALTGPATLTIQRLLPGPIERVWAYLTQSDLRRQWLAAGEMEMRVARPSSWSGETTSSATRPARGRPLFPQSTGWSVGSPNWTRPASSPSPGEIPAASHLSWPPKAAKCC